MNNIPWKLTGVPGCVRIVEQILTPYSVDEIILIEVLEPQLSISGVGLLPEGLV